MQEHLHLKKKNMQSLFITNDVWELTHAKFERPQEEHDDEP